jgi:preprotein translocase subunit SecD
MLNTFPRWKYILLSIVILFGLIYALPNIYPEDPAVQVSGIKGAVVDEKLVEKIKAELSLNNFPYKSVAIEDVGILARFNKTEQQLKTKDFIKSLVGDEFSVALNLAPVIPRWLDILGAKPMKLGLDLRGGVRFLMEVDVASGLDRRLDGDYSDLRNKFREEKIRYKKFRIKKDGVLLAEFATPELRQQANQYLSRNYPHLELTRIETDDLFSLEMRLSAAQINETRTYTVEQTISTLRNRVNELGVAEAIVQRQGANRVVVELPGIQDTARAKDILGKTATLDFVMADHENDVNQALQGRVPPGTRILPDQFGRKVLVKKRVILTGDSITGATSSFDSRDNKPAVSIRLGGSGIGLFKETTMNNIGKRMAVVYRETKVEDKFIDGEAVKEKKTTETIISLATIQSALGTSFQITGLSLEESRDLALLLRAGALPATTSIVEERIVGPSMGQENIDMGMISIVVGLSLVLLFMTIYYSVFGVVANIALFLNLVLLVAIMSLLGATLTLPGIAGIVLTLGMAVDANVLIFERIREELRAGMTPQASIQRGFSHAFSTIVDANLTTLIVGVILFAVGTGPVKGFAITLSIGILTSMFTAITGTRAMVNFLYNGKTSKRLLVGI